MRTKNTNKYRVEDWAGNILDYTGVFYRPTCVVPMEFDSFEDGWSWIYENVKDIECYQDLYVEKVVQNEK